MTRRITLVCLVLLATMAATENAHAQFGGIRLGPIRVSGSPQRGIQFEVDNGRRPVDPPYRVLPVDPGYGRRPEICPPEWNPPCPPPNHRIQPELPPTQPQKPVVDERTQKLRELVRQGKAALQAGDYTRSLALANEMVELAPKNGNILQFRAAVHLGNMNYPLAAADTYNALLVGPIWTMASIKDVYGDPRAYRRDLEWLQLTTDEKPQNLAHQFLTAYHALVRNDLTKSQTHLREVLKIKPSEPVAQKLLEIVQQKQAGATTAIAEVN